MKKLLAVIALAVLITGCYAKESNKDYDKAEESKARRY
jgi:PBP1b-binding outer membrane lipoprotein LpoB